jgi:hypothetical protein
MPPDVDDLLWAVQKVRLLVGVLAAIPKLPDGMTVVRGPDGSSYMLRNSNLNSLPACARRVDCSLIVPRAVDRDASGL